MTAAALLRAILDRPDDDLPRLAYADWCEEAGDDARAEFIRLQCRIAALEASCDCAACVRLRGGGQHHNGPCAVGRELAGPPGSATHPRHRVNALLALRLPRPDGSTWYAGNAWSGGIADLLAGYGSQWELRYRRGFVAGVSCPLRAWLAHGPAAVRAQPVERVALSDVAPECRHGPAAGTRYRYGFTAFPPDVWCYVSDHSGFADYFERDTREGADAVLSAGLLDWARAARPAEGGAP